MNINFDHCLWHFVETSGYDPTLPCNGTAPQLHSFPRCYGRFGFCHATDSIREQGTGNLQHLWTFVSRHNNAFVFCNSEVGTM